MAYLAIFRVISKYVLGFAAVLLVPLVVALYYESVGNAFGDETTDTLAFLETIGVCLIISLLSFLLGRRGKEESLYRRDSILLVALIWLITPALASLPFIFSNAIPHPIDAYFESMSGLTTTGATILHPKAYDPQTGKELPIVIQHPTNPLIYYTFFGTVEPARDLITGKVLAEGVESLGKTLLFWRSFLQWLGGVGIVVLFVAILPSLSIRGKVLYEAEVTGPLKEGIRPRIKDTAIALCQIYVGLSIAQIILLSLADPTLPFLDVVTLTFSTLSTGGFTTHNAPMIEYLNLVSMLIIMIFMVLGGVNFALFYYCFKRKFFRLNQPEFFYYLIILTIGSILVSFPLWNNPTDFLRNSNENYSIWTALGYGSFQAISAQTSTGFTITNYDLWPNISQFQILILMYIGGMSGSTAGGVKIIRFVIVLRVLRNKIATFFNPDLYRIVKVGEKEITDKTAGTVLAFFSIIIFLVVFGCLLLIYDDIDPLSSLGIISTCINNTGLFFSGIGSTGSMAYLSDFSKIVAILWMLLGRLEFLSILALLMPSFWSHK